MAATTGDKPSPWVFQQFLTDANAWSLWPGCCMALPFWDRGRICEDISGHGLHALFGAGIDPVGDWDVSTYGTCLDFDGAANQDLSIAAPPAAWVDGQPRMSWEIIFRCDNPVEASGIIQGLVGKYTTTTDRRSWRIYVIGDEVALQVSSDGVGNEVQVTTNANLNGGTWAHVILTYDAGAFVAYKDGVLLTDDGTFNVHTTIFPGVIEPIRIGARSDGNRLSGQIAGIRIWRNRVLGQDEVTRLFEDPWEMYRPNIPLLPSYALEHGAGGAAAGPWELAGTVAAGVETFLVPGLTNGVSYDVKTVTVDSSGNASAGSTAVSGTPLGLVTTLRDVRLARKTRSRPTGATRARMRR